MKNETTRAVRIGGACISTYLVSYITRNVLSVSAPQMVEEAFFTKEYTGLLSSVCFIFYAVGQLINGFIGDRARPKYMVSAGLLISGLAALTVPMVQDRMVHFVCFAVMGYSLSMLRGPHDQDHLRKHRPWPRPAPLHAAEHDLLRRAADRQPFAYGNTA